MTCVVVVADGRFETFKDCAGNLYIRFEHPGFSISTTFAGTAFGLQFGGVSENEFFVFLDGKKVMFGGRDYLTVPASEGPQYIDLASMTSKLARCSRLRARLCAA